MTETVDFQTALQDRRYLWDAQNSPMSVRTANALYSARLRYVMEIVAKSEAELLMLPHLGRAQLNEVRAIVEPMGLSFATTFTNAPKKPEDFRQAIIAARQTFGDEIDVPIVTEDPTISIRAAAKEVLENAGFSSADFADKAQRYAIRRVIEAIEACDQAGLDSGEVFGRLSGHRSRLPQLVTALHTLKK